MENKIFLLGGYDLEMVEIRNLLQEKGILYFDKQLNWENAFLTQYADVLEQYGNKENTCIYGIELQEKELPYIPPNYFRIDHHNDFSHKKSSLEQVAEVLGMILNHDQRLVAANDSGYIPAMQQAGATQEEIKEIRRKDRETQGVTEEDEKSAEEAIRNKVIKGNLIEIYSKSSRFSPICDRLFPYEKLLIYTENELMYYGTGKDVLVEMFQEEIKKGKMFHGGGDKGFMGAVKEVFARHEISAIIQTIKIEIINI